MKGFSNVVIIGYVSSKLVTCQTQSGIYVLLEVAIDETYAKGDTVYGEIVQLPVRFYGKRAEQAKRLLKYGSRVAISGKLRQTSWNVDDNAPKLYLMGEHCELAGSSDPPEGT